MKPLNERIYFDKASKADGGHIRILLSRCPVHYPSGCCVASVEPHRGTVEAHPELTQEVIDYVFVHLKAIADEAIRKAKGE